MKGKTLVTNSKYQQKSSYDILVTGATGFIGSRLVRKLNQNGYSVRALSRKKLSDSKGVKYERTDVFDVDKLTKSFQGVQVAYYLLHSMEGDKKHWKEFATRERIQSQNFLKSATKAGVKRIIYLGGLVNESIELSPHMKSRHDVGEILASGNIPVTELRASVIIGANGGSFTMLQYLVENLGVMICPKWVKSLAQPIAVEDVIDYLVRCLEIPETSGSVFEIGGPEKLTYEQLMRRYAQFLKKRLRIIEIPFLTPRLSSYWVDLITPVKASLARPLIDSLVHDSVVQGKSIAKIVSIPLKTINESFEITTKEANQYLPEEKLEKKRTSFILNQKLLLTSLVCMAILGTTYYWLDDRIDPFQIEWIVLATGWYIGIGFSILFVSKKTRLGYLISGILSWITLSFWLLDNFHVTFQESVIASKPSIEMTIINFVGIGIAGLSVGASHNVFHKLREYQTKRRNIF